MASPTGGEVGSLTPKWLMGSSRALKCEPAAVLEAGKLGWHTWTGQKEVFHQQIVLTPLPPALCIQGGCAEHERCWVHPLWVLGRFGCPQIHPATTQSTAKGLSCSKTAPALGKMLVQRETGFLFCSSPSQTESTFAKYISKSLPVTCSHGICETRGKKKNTHTHQKPNRI